MGNTTQPKYGGDAIRFEQESHYSRDVVTFTAPASTLSPGLVVGTTNADTTIGWGPLTDAATATKIGVLIDEVNAAGEFVIVARDAIAVNAGLEFDAAVDEAAAKASLAAAGIIIRASA